ncbi:MAG: hypothetical protein ACLRQX_04595 [Turicibacter sanguinis]
MKKSWKLALGAAMALTLVTGCSTGSEDSGKQKLVVSTWGLSQDVWEQEVKIPFEEKYNCELVLDTGGTNDRYTKLLIIQIQRLILLNYHNQRQQMDMRQVI